MKLKRIFALTASAVLAAALLAGCDWLAWLEYLEGQGGSSSSSSSSSSAVTRADDTTMTASWQPAAAAARARAAGGLTVTSKDGKTFTITGIPADAQSCAVSADIAVYHTVTVTSTGSGTVTAEGLASGKAQVEEGQSITITAAPTTGLGADPSYGVATIEINGEPLPKDEFDSDSHQFTIQVDSDTTVNVGFEKKRLYIFT